MNTIERAQSDTDTIAAVATPPGRGGIGIVRLSGPEAWKIAATLVRLRRPLEAGRAVLAEVLDPSDSQAAPIDEAVVTAFATPHSYTGEDVVEIAAHGSPVVLETLLRGSLAAGARLAMPGEFTQRAFLNGRIDLTQAEAVQDLIAAQTLEQARMAAQQLGGALSRRVAPVKEELVTLIALLEAGMDFAAGELDDVDVVSPRPDPNCPRKRSQRAGAAGAELRPGTPSARRSFSGPRRPAQRWQEFALQSAARARTRHRDAFAGNDPRHRRGGDGRRRHPSAADRHRRTPARR